MSNDDANAYIFVVLVFACTVGFLLCSVFGILPDNRVVPNVESVIVTQVQDIPLASIEKGGNGYNVSEYEFDTVVGNDEETGTKRKVCVVNTKGEVVTKQVAFVNVIVDGKNTLTLSKGSVKTQKGKILKNKDIATLHISEGMKQVSSEELDKVAWNVQKANESKK